MRKQFPHNSVFMDPNAVQGPISYSATQLYGITALQNFSYAMTAQLSCQMQKFIANASIQIGREEREMSIELELQCKTRIWHGLRTLILVPCDTSRNHQYHKVFVLLVLSINHWLFYKSHIAALRENKIMHVGHSVPDDLLPQWHGEIYRMLVYYGNCHYNAFELCICTYVKQANLQICAVLSRMCDWNMDINRHQYCP